MATALTTTADAASWSGHVKVNADQIFNRQAAAFFLLDENGKITLDGGETIGSPAFYGTNPNVKFYSGYETLDLNDFEFAKEPQWDWKQFNGPTPLSRIQVKKNQGRARKFDLPGQKLRVTAGTMTRDFGTALYADGTANSGLGTAKQIDGLGAAIGDNNGGASAVYGGITRNSSATWWYAQIDDTTTYLTPDTLLAQFMACQKMGLGPSGWACFTTAFQYRRLLNQIAGPERIMRGPETQRMISGGFLAMEYMGNPIVYDPACPTDLDDDIVTSGAGTLWIINRDYVKIVGLGGGDDAMFGMGDMPDTQVDGMTGQAEVVYQGWTFRPWQTPVNQDAVVSHMFWDGNLVSSVPRSTGAFRKLSET